MFGEAPIVIDEEEDQEDDENTYLFLDSGCHQTCHGERWMEKFTQATGYAPEWLHREVKTLNGIGGGTQTLGNREFYVTFENNQGQYIPGEVVSTEIKGSSAPMLLSLPSQEALGLVVDFEQSEIYSKLLNMTRLQE